MRKLITGLLAMILLTIMTSVAAKADTTREYTDAQKVFLQEVYEHITERDSDFEVLYEGSGQTWDVDDIYYILSAIDSPLTDNDYDYLRGNISQIQCEYMPYNFSMVKYHFTFSWFEDKEQTEIVDEKAQSIIESGNVKDMNDYEKVRYVHDYIIDNVSYDKSQEKFSAYEGLINGSTVCQGFALLTYKMLTKAGIQCRYVVGKYIPEGSTEGENHAWNLVKLGGQWYYLDTTWDEYAYSQIQNDSNRYLYFLKGSAGFENEHVMDAAENGENFDELYNISSVDYNKYLGSGTLVDSGESDKAVTPYQFFKLNDDGTITSKNKIIMYVNKAAQFIMEHILQILAILLVVLIIHRVTRKV